MVFDEHLFGQSCPVWMLPSTVLSFLHGRPILFSSLQPTPCSTLQQGSSERLKGLSGLPPPPPPTHTHTFKDYWKEILVKPLWRWISHCMQVTLRGRRIVTFHPCLSQQTQGERDQHLPDMRPTGSSSPVTSTPWASLIQTHWRAGLLLGSFRFWRGLICFHVALTSRTSMPLSGLIYSAVLVRCSLWDSEVSLILKTNIAIAECSLLLTCLYFTGNLGSSNKKKKDLCFCFYFAVGFWVNHYTKGLKKGIQFPLTQAFFIAPLSNDTHQRTVFLLIS